jgi:hypothetical protein
MAFISQKHSFDDVGELLFHRWYQLLCSTSRRRMCEQRLGTHLPKNTKSEMKFENSSFLMYCIHNIVSTVSVFPEIISFYSKIYSTNDWTGGSSGPPCFLLCSLGKIFTHTVLYGVMKNFAHHTKLVDSHRQNFKMVLVAGSSCMKYTDNFKD